MDEQISLFLPKMTRKSKPKAPNPTFEVAQFFVTAYLGREWGKSEGSALANAKSLLKDYSKDDIIGTLKALKQGVLSGKVNMLAGLRYGEPALIEQWLTYKKTPPPTYEQHAYKTWCELTNTIPESGEQCLCHRLTLPS
jgi:hypothetical protein